LHDIENIAQEKQPPGLDHPERIQGNPRLLQRGPALAMPGTENIAAPRTRRIVDNSLTS